MCVSLSNIALLLKVTMIAINPPLGDWWSPCVGINYYVREYKSIILKMVIPPLLPWARLHWCPPQRAQIPCALPTCRYPMLSSLPVSCVQETVTSCRTSYICCMDVYLRHEIHECNGKAYDPSRTTNLHGDNPILRSQVSHEHWVIAWR